jgi:hypothetical protein
MMNFGKDIKYWLLIIVVSVPTGFSCVQSKYSYVPKYHLLITREYHKILDKNDLDTIFKYYYFEGADKLDFYPIVYDKKTGIGLYSFELVKIVMSHGYLNKALKFNNYMYLYNEMDTTENINRFNEFQNKYQKLFTLSQLNDIKRTFFKGNEFY